MENCEEPESGYVGEMDAGEYVGSRMMDVEAFRVSGSNVLARGRRYGRQWLLKGLREELRGSTAARRQLMKEFEVHSRLSHPGIVQTVGFEDVEGLGECIVEEWIEGKTLRETLHDGLPGKRERQRLMREIIAAVAYMHSRGVVHRDLKPSNIMVRAAGGEPVIIDFGLADTDDYVELKQSAGTDGFISPEQREAGGANTADDVYSLGVMMRELLPEYSGLAGRCTAPVGVRPANGGDLLKIYDRRVRRSKRVAKWILAAVAVTTVSLSGWHLISLTKSARESGSRVAMLTRENKEREKRVTELTDSLTFMNAKVENMGEKVSEAQKALDDVQKPLRLKEAASKEWYKQVDKILKRYDREVFSAITPEDQEEFSSARTRLLKEFQEMVGQACSNLKGGGLTESELNELNTSMTYYSLMEYDKYQKKWLKKMYSNMPEIP